MADSTLPHLSAADQDRLREIIPCGCSHTESWAEARRHFALYPVRDIMIMCPDDPTNLFKYRLRTIVIFTLIGAAAGAFLMLAFS